MNDPVYGFVKIPSDLAFDVIQHPYFQRLRRIKQMGLADFVYPGAVHTRFQHAIGAMHLMSQTLTSLESKGVYIMDIEREAAQLAILLHDIGHGPFSHVLEYSILQGISHEEITLRVMEKLNEEFQGQLQLAIEMFTGKYNRPFFHQLISSQLDMDRLDYLNRDSFFSGVVEGRIGVDRIIKMLNVHEDRLVVEEKGLLSVESFLNARRLMYWQVYLHKTSLSADVVLNKALKRARRILQTDDTLFCPKALKTFLSHPVDAVEIKENDEILEAFLSLDDTDIWYCLKVWKGAEDQVLAKLAEAFVGRHLFKVSLLNEEPEERVIEEIKNRLRANGISENDLDFYFQSGKVSNAGYIPKNSSINILMKSGEILDVADVSDLPTVKALGKIVEKHYLCWTNTLYLQQDLL